MRTSPAFDEAHPLRSLDALAFTPFNILVIPATARPLQPCRHVPRSRRCAPR